MHRPVPGLLVIGLCGAWAGSTLASDAAPPPATPADAPADFRRVLSQARKVQLADAAAWQAYRFRRRALREQVVESGEVLVREDLEFLVTPGSDGFDEVLLRLDGRDPRPEEVRRHRRLAKFTTHYRALLDGEGRDDVEWGYSLSHLLGLSSYRYVGREQVNGVACHRVDFTPGGAPAGRGLASRFAQAMEGSLWITVEGNHLARARARTVRPVSFALSLMKVLALDVSLDSQPVGDGTWLPLRIEVLTRTRFLIRQVQKRNSYVYSEFAPAGSAGDPRATGAAYSSPAIGRSRGARTR